MRLLFSIILLLLFLNFAVKSQTNNSFSFIPDRPGMATPPSLLPSGNFQFEGASQYEKNKMGTANNYSFLFFSPLLRYGVVKNLEVRIQSDYTYNRTNDGLASSTTMGLDPVTIGSKIKLVEQHNVLPNISLLINLALPYLGNEEFRPVHLAPSAYILMSNSISEKLSLCYNYGLSWDGSSSVPNNFYAISLGIGLNKKLSTFIENYGYFTRGSDPSLYLDSGLAYLINDHLQIDLSATGNLRSFFRNYFFNTGIAWNINWLKQTFNQ